MKTITINLRDRDLAAFLTVNAIPITLDLHTALSSSPVRLALAVHRLNAAALCPESDPFGDGEWVVSDPESGCRVLVVQGNYRGFKVLSDYMTPTQAARAGKAQAMALAENKGPGFFLATIRAARERLIAAHNAAAVEA